MCFFFSCQVCIFSVILPNSLFLNDKFKLYDESYFIIFTLFLAEDYSKGVEFDPIRQHRYFCPWIATGNVAPGWKQTLTALQREKGSSPHSPKNSPSASLIKVRKDVQQSSNVDVHSINILMLEQQWHGTVYWSFAIPFWP